MGNYNCQECITKEANLLNELLLDTNLLSSDEPSIEESKTHETKIKPKKNIKSRPSQEDLKKLLKEKDLNEDQKKFVEKIIKRNSLDLYLENNQKQEQNSLKENNDTPEIKITNLEPIDSNTNQNNEAIIIQNNPYPEEEEEKNSKNDSPQDEDVKIVLKRDATEVSHESKKYKIDSYESNNDNNNMDYLFEKNDRENEPQDTMRPDFRKPIIPKGNSNINDNDKEIGPRDSHRKNQNDFSNNDDNMDGNRNGNDKNKIPLNRGEINNDNNNRKQINIIIDNNNKNFKDNNQMNNNIIQNQIFLSPGYNKELHLETFENNKKANYNININNDIEKERKAITLGPYLNQVEEIKNANTSGPVINTSDANRTKNEIAYYQESSQRDLEMTISSRENPLLMGDDKGGNMNYLEKQYQAYQNKMRYIYDEENF